VKLLQHDMTGMAERLYDGIRHGLHELPPSSPMMPECAKTAGLVVSLNLLSQLWVIPRAYALQKFPGIDAERLDDWCGQIVQSHYDLLKSLPGGVCLVADHEFVKQDRAGTIVSRGSTIADLRLPLPSASWTWHIAPIGENRQFSKELIVGAWHLK
jgi:hypothetical protein